MILGTRPSMAADGTARFLTDALEQVVPAIEGVGAFVIALGALLALVRFLDVLIRHRTDPHAFVTVRLGLGRYLALGLEFQLAGDVLRTAVAPTLDELAVLASVAGIRTALNYFLNREIKEEQRQLAEPPAT
jgi:uncharacterized membrane protein